MIENRKQYEVTKLWVTKFKEALNELEIIPELDPLVQKLLSDSYKSYIQTLEESLIKYKNDN